MKFKDYDANNPPYVELANTVESIYPILEAFAPNQSYDQLFKLNAVYQWTKHLMADANKQSVCSAGCYHCCAQKVAVKPIEIDNIKNNLNAFPPRDNGRFCPFLNLNEGKCGIYEFRPLSCRSMLTFDNPKYCITDEDHHIFNSYMLNSAFTQILSGFEDLGQSLAHDIVKIFAGKDQYLDEAFTPLQIATKSV
ncbi:YkgJ family cysteine cluster protein [Pseudomonas fluorescens]|uniref:YkgJ family cysteine cluster protein n=1 Tax=Pseudomonas fluorescens TaxID=294 RepID=UPI003D191C5E